MQRRGVRMKQLDECKKYVEDIKKIDEDISEIESRATSPKGQRITGMPRGGSMGNQTESYMIKLEALEIRRKRLENSLLEKWEEARSILSENSVRNEFIELLWYRFCRGYKWKVCSEIMNKRYKDQNWNDNKCYRIYRKIKKRVQ